MDIKLSAYPRDSDELSPEPIPAYLDASTGLPSPAYIEETHDLYLDDSERTMHHTVLRFGRRLTAEEITIADEALRQAGFQYLLWDLALAPQVQRAVNQAARARIIIRDPLADLGGE
jgi:hypothetical protein